MYLTNFTSCSDNTFFCFDKPTNLLFPLKIDLHKLKFNEDYCQFLMYAKSEVGNEDKITNSEE